MSLKGILYHVASGAIMSIHEGNLADVQGAVTDGYAMLGYEGTDAISFEDECIVAAAIAPRSTVAPTASATSAAPGDSITISNLPVNCYLFVNNDLVHVSGGSYQYSQESEGPAFIWLAGQYKCDHFIIRFSALASEQERLKTLVDADAEASRSRVVTPGSGQAMTYLRKADAAIAFLAGQTLTDPQMLRITDEAQRLGVTNEEAAQSLVDTANTWEALDAQIDNIRLVAKKNIDAATTPEAALGVYTAITWPV